MRDSRAYTFIFALIICVGASLILALAATSLKKRQDKNVKIDIQKNILAAVGLPENKEGKLMATQVEELYKNFIIEEVINAEGVKVEKTLAELIKEKKPKDMAIFKRRAAEGSDEVSAYAFPIQGKGLWSTLYGYLALEKDMETIKGITFYKHGETPGLGAEIEKEWFQNNFKGKKIVDASGALAPIKVVKGKVVDMVPDPNQAIHAVDGISGATFTGIGVQKLVEKALRKYEPYFKKVKNPNHAQLGMGGESWR